MIVTRRVLTFVLARKSRNFLSKWPRLMRLLSDAPMLNRNVSFPKRGVQVFRTTQTSPRSAARARLLQFISLCSQETSTLDAAALVDNLNISIGTYPLRGSMKCGSNWRVPLRKRRSSSIEHDKTFCTRNWVASLLLNTYIYIYIICAAFVRENRFIRAAQHPRSEPSVFDSKVHDS